MLLQDILGHAARRAPSAPALVVGSQTLTFAELDRRAAALGRLVAGLTKPGDRVAVVADNCPAWMACYYGVPGAGRVLTPLNQRLAAAEQAELVARSGAALVLGQRLHLDALEPIVSRQAIRPTILDIDESGSGEGDADREPDRSGAHAATERDLAWLLFTSGTTSQPKGVELTHRSLLTAVLTTALARPVAPDDIYLFPFPLCHVAGYNTLLFHLQARPVVLLPRFSAADLVEAVRRHGVTALSLAPTMLRSVLDHLKASGETLPTLRTIGYGASPIAPELLREAAARLHVELSQGYGMTELSGNAVFLSASDHRRALVDAPHLLRAAGRPSPLATVDVVGADGRTVAPGDTGEIVVRGDQVASRYWQDPDATAASWRDGWFHTGDLGRWDEEGYLYVVDRRKDVIVTGGENVASREVEDALLSHPSVAAAAVVGVPDRYWGEAVCAVVVPRLGASIDEEALVAHVREHLAGFKRPRHVFTVDALPVNAGGKVVKPEVRRLALEQLGRDERS